MIRDTPQKPRRWQTTDPGGSGQPPGGRQDVGIAGFSPLFYHGDLATFNKWL
jgi:hypothetical protein